MSKHLHLNFPGFCPDFLRFFPDFRQIKTSVGALPPLPPAPLHPTCFPVVTVHKLALSFPSDCAWDAIFLLQVVRLGPTLLVIRLEPDTTYLAKRVATETSAFTQVFQMQFVYLPLKPYSLCDCVNHSMCSVHFYASRLVCVHFRPVMMTLFSPSDGSICG